MADQEFVAELSGLDGQALPQVGGKAANLGELIGAGLPVPPGFVVTTAAYAEVADRVPELLERSGAAAARSALCGTDIPAPIADAVRAAYADLGADVPVAVRSSATAEDLPWASFAGQQDTFLNVVGTDAVLDAVRRCWASLWTDRAVSYRTTQGIDHRAVRLAVVVQRMVDAATAGVLFTADPVTGTRGRTVLDASPGLGEAVVSGAVNPDHIVVDGSGTTVTPGDKAVRVRALPGGGTETVLAASGSGEPCLNQEQIDALVALGRRVEAHFGAPQDIEWAFDQAGAPWLTQSRPITTLHPLPEESETGLRVYFCLTLAQGLTRPLTPMGMAAIRVLTAEGSRRIFGIPVADPLAGAPILREAGGRAFADLTGVLGTDLGRAIIPYLLDEMESRAAVVLRSLFTDRPVRRASRLRLARRVLRALARYRLPIRIGLALVSPAAGRRNIARTEARTRERTADPGEIPAAERLDRAVRVLGEVFEAVPRVAPIALVGGIATQAVVYRLAPDEVDAVGADEIRRSLPHNSTTEMDLELWALAVRLRADPAAAAALRDLPSAELARRHTAGRALPDALRAGVAAFLHRHGHRAVAEIDIGMPRWADDPAHVYGVLANYLRLDDPDRAPDVVFARGARAAQDAVTEVVARVRRRSRLRAVAVRLVLRRVRELAGLREVHKDLLIRILSHARDQLAAVGADLVARGLLDDAEDVFFLDLREVYDAVHRGADHRGVIATRRAGYEREVRRRHVPRVLLSDGTEPEAAMAAAAPEGALAGTPASAGTVTAPARVVLDPVGAHLEPGEILVVPSTDPGWTPLFLTAGGLVMEMGGPTSHGAVVAREYGIPAIVGVPDATTRISTGDVITVDGAAGHVRVNGGGT